MGKIEHVNKETQENMAFTTTDLADKLFFNTELDLTGDRVPDNIFDSDVFGNKKIQTQQQKNKK